MSEYEENCVDGLVENYWEVYERSRVGEPLEMFGKIYVLQEDAGEYTQVEAFDPYAKDKEDHTDEYWSLYWYLLEHVRKEEPISVFGKTYVLQTNGD